jgi:SAM-dependent methyltransferase
MATRDRGPSLEGEPVTNYGGVLKIVRFNWPWYVLAGGVTLAAIICFSFGVFRGLWMAAVVAGFILADLWLLSSLAVSHYVYDRSGVSRGAWLDGVDASKVKRAAIFHAGHDEASATVARRLPSADCGVFDFYDESRNGTASLKRARALAGHRDAQIVSGKIPLTEETLDLGMVVFAAHEIRDDAERAALFREINRVLAPSGRIIVVEHLRDVWNFLAYGPGAFHFLSRQTWRRSFSRGGFKLMRESRCSVFVRVFELQKES